MLEQVAARETKPSKGGIASKRRWVSTPGSRLRTARVAVVNCDREPWTGDS
jgi:hypothetical protein